MPATVSPAVRALVPGCRPRRSADRLEEARALARALSESSGQAPKFRQRAAPNTRSAMRHRVEVTTTGPPAPPALPAPGRSAMPTSSLRWSRRLPRESPQFPLLTQRPPVGSGRITALLRSCDRRSAIGRRDFAILVVLSRLGLRAGEAARLCLSDIDWRCGDLTVRGKGNRIDYNDSAWDLNRPGFVGGSQGGSDQ